MRRQDSQPLIEVHGASPSDDDEAGGAEEGKGPGEVFDGGGAVAELDVGVCGDHHHPVGCDAVGAVCSGDGPVGEVRDLDEHRDADLVDVEGHAVGGHLDSADGDGCEFALGSETEVVEEFAAGVVEPAGDQVDAGPLIRSVCCDDHVPTFGIVEPGDGGVSPGAPGLGGVVDHDGLVLQGLDDVAVVDQVHGPRIGERDGFEDVGMVPGGVERL